MHWKGGGGALWRWGSIEKVEQRRTGRWRKRRQNNRGIGSGSWRTCTVARTMFVECKNGGGQAWAVPSIDGTRLLFVSPCLFARAEVRPDAKAAGNKRQDWRGSRASHRANPKTLKRGCHATPLVRKRRHPMTKHYLYFHSGTSRRADRTIASPRSNFSHSRSGPFMRYTLRASTRGYPLGRLSFERWTGGSYELASHPTDFTPFCYFIRYNVPGERWSLQNVAVH